MNQSKTIVGMGIFLGIFLGILAILLSAASSAFGGTTLAKFISLVLFLLPVIIAAVLFFADKESELKESLINLTLFLFSAYFLRYAVLLIWQYVV